MKKGMSIMYGGLLGIALMMQSCQEDPIFPVGNGIDPIDTTWTTDPNGNGNPIDSTNTGGGTTPDSTLVINFNGGVFTGNATPFDSVGGNGNPMDTLGGN